MPDPRADYEARLDAHVKAAAGLDPADRNFANLRLGTAILWIAAVVVTFKAGLPGAGLLVGSIGLFVILVVLHGRTVRRRQRAERAAAFYEAGIARLTNAWMGKGEAGERFRNDSHLFAEDIDLFGRGSLFELLCAARTRTGESTLAGWLLAPAPPEEAKARQKAVEELRSRVDLREDLAVLGESAKKAVDSESLAEWSRSPSPLASGPLPAVAAVVGVSVVVAFVAWLLGAPIWLFTGAIVARLAFAALFSRRFAEVVREFEGKAREIERLAGILDRVERERFESPALADIRKALETEGVPASKRLARLGQLFSLLDAGANQFFAIAYHAMCVGEIATGAIDRWRATHGSAVPRWTQALGRLEALSSLAGFAYEHPEHPFPEIAESGAVAEAEALGHPLIPDAKCVRNDLALAGAGLQVLVVSGSNMSGKSTLLRTLGVNIVLAFAGAPVCAKRLRVSPVALGASIRRNDSLQEGTSRFYAEITRLNEIMKGAAKGPLCFLVDEILSGTNSHDRAIGAEAVVRGLVQRGAIGLVTTHDLSLAKVAEALAAKASNVHFEDHLENGRISFDYKLHPGVVTKSNALELMRAVGLDV